MPDKEQYELAVRNRLASAVVDLDEIEEQTRMYIADRLTPSSQPFDFVELMKRLSEVLRECHTILRDHAEGTNTASHDLLLVTSTTIRSADQVLGVLAVAARQNRLRI